jgi:hypothetical protein
MQCTPGTEGGRLESLAQGSEGGNASEAESDFGENPAGRPEKADAEMDDVEMEIRVKLDGGQIAPSREATALVSSVEIEPKN